MMDNLHLFAIPIQKSEWALPGSITDVPSPSSTVQIPPCPKNIHFGCTFFAPNPPLDRGGGISAFFFEVGCLLLKKIVPVVFGYFWWKFCFSTEKSIFSQKDENFPALPATSKSKEILELSLKFIYFGCLRSGGRQFIFVYQQTSTLYMHAAKKNQLENDPAWIWKLNDPIIPKLCSPR